MNEINCSCPPVSVCIPTKDRPEDLKRCIEALLKQTVLPAEIVVIDDGNLPVETYRKLVEPVTQFKYYKKDFPSSAASKNMAKKLAAHELILILDDDTVAEKDYLQKILEVFEKDTEHRIGLVGGLTVNRKRSSLGEKLYKRFFLLDNGKPGRIQPWAFQTGFDEVEREEEVQWLSTAVSCFRREVLEEFSFYVHHQGRVALEDVDFGWKVSRKYKIVLTPAARIYHFHSPGGRESQFETGFKQGYNRCLIFKKMGTAGLKNTLCFVWAMTGFVLGMMGSERIYQAFGNLTGVWAFLKKGMLAAPS